LCHLASITPQLAAGDRLLVVADNCSDDTATLARQAGAQVVERR
jgi:glycosyltransferase involved in cell wall biosynthesis